MIPGALVAIHGQRLPSLFQHHIQVLGTLFVPHWHQYLRRLGTTCKAKDFAEVANSLEVHYTLRCKQLPLLVDFKQGISIKRLPLVDLWVPKLFHQLPADIAAASCLTSTKS